MNALLDTNVISDAIKARLTASIPFDHAMKSGACTSVVCVGELLFGAINSPRPLANENAIRNFISKIHIYHSDDLTAWHYGIVKDALKRRGKHINENDYWIAATALQHNLTLMTFDRDFSHVPGLTVVSP